MPPHGPPERHDDPWPLDVAACLNSGQVFHWEHLPDAGGWVGALGEEAVRIPANFSASDPVAPNVRRYFALDTDWRQIIGTFPAEDEILRNAVAFCPGLRILRQPRWECLATFITSSLKQVAHIRQISLTLRRKFGRLLEINGACVHSYPTAERMASLPEAELRSCALGYRAPFLLGAARAVAEGRADLEAWATLPDADLRAALKTLPGVGEKIAHCVMLFAYGRWAAFPVDVWIERVLREWYFRGRAQRFLTSQRIREFAQSHFGPNGGCAQQYLFHFARMTKGAAGDPGQNPPQISASVSREPQAAGRRRKAPC